MYRDLEVPYKSLEKDFVEQLPKMSAAVGHKDHRMPALRCRLFLGVGFRVRGLWPVFSAWCAEVSPLGVGGGLGFRVRGLWPLFCAWCAEVSPLGVGGETPLAWSLPAVSGCRV